METHAEAVARTHAEAVEDGRVVASPYLIAHLWGKTRQAAEAAIKRGDFSVAFELVMRHSKRAKPMVRISNVESFWGNVVPDHESELEALIEHASTLAVGWVCWVVLDFAVTGNEHSSDH